MAPTEDKAQQILNQQKNLRTVIIASLSGNARWLYRAFDHALPSAVAIINQDTNTLAELAREMA